MSVWAPRHRGGGRSDSREQTKKRESCLVPGRGFPIPNNIVIALILSGVQRGTRHSGSPQKRLIPSSARLSFRPEGELGIAEDEIRVKCLTAERTQFNFPDHQGFCSAWTGPEKRMSG